MPENGRRPRVSKPARLVLRVVGYYVLVIGGGYWLWRAVPHTSLIPQMSMDSLLGGGPAVGNSKGGVPIEHVGSFALAITVALAMVGALLLELPVVWIYQLTRGKRGYSQTLAQMLVIMPVVIAAAFAMLKYSLALAFGLGGVVAAVRFRNTLDDSKDAVYVFLASAMGLAAAVDLPIAAVISVMFNAVVLLLWYTDFGYAPIELEGAVADRRLERARQMRRTGTFVAKLDEHLLEGLNADQLESVARKALKRARDNEGKVTGEFVKREGKLIIRTTDLERTRREIESRLDDVVKKWSLDAVSTEADGTGICEYQITLKKNEGPEPLLAFVRATGAPDVIDAEMN